LNFTTLNFAPFVENIFHVTDKFSITPGFRFEYVKSIANGYNTFDSGVVNTNKSFARYIPLAGIGLQYKTTNTSSLYGNFTQAYRPTDYSQLSPIATTSIIDPHLKDANGFNADLGFRGTVKNFLSFDVGAFWLQYNNRIGLIEKKDANGNIYTYRTNVANSRHLGAETYLEINPVKALTRVTKYGTVSFFNSFSFIDARYTTSEFKNNFVENAPRFINRFGATYAVEGFSVTLLVSHTSKCFSDAENTIKSDDAVVGVVPKYTVLDLSATYKIKFVNIKAGVNNLTNEKYFTKRTDEYPGPGIIPSIGRSFYIGLGIRVSTL
jgi:Fe(3+) dicitrate transport protein